MASLTDRQATEQRLAAFDHGRREGFGEGFWWGMVVGVLACFIIAAAIITFAAIHN